MRKTHRIIAFLLIFAIFASMPVMVAAAQPSIQESVEDLPLGPTVVKDPESPTGYTVKFLYQNDTAETVTFAGDIGLRNWADPSDTKQYTPFEYVPDTDLDGDGVTDICLMRSGAFTAPMEKLENGLWYYEVPLAAGANQYWFYIDGNTNYMVPDPANHPQWSPNSNWDTKNAYNAVYVPYDQKQGNELMKAREAELPRTDGKTGTWSYVPFKLNETDEKNQYLAIYLPYGYDPNRTEPYKTIYMQHGGGQDESDWMGIGSVQKIMDNLAAEGRTEPAVIVAPGSTAVGNLWGGNYDNLFNIIIPFVEKNYNVSTEAMDRAFAGLSMGSMITQGIINADATKFGYYGPWSGGVSVRNSTENLDQVYMLFAGGRYDFGNPSQAAIDKALQYTGANYKYVEVAGAHDFNTWCQMFRIFLDEYLWKPEAFVQEGPKVVRDAESPTGYTAQFVYKNDEAETVTFAGDIGLKNWADRSDTKQYTPFEYKPGLMRSGAFTAPMEKREDGYWYYEVPLAAGANQYWFYIDGNTRYMVPDPANHPQWSPNSNWNTKNAYNAVYVPYDEKQDFEPMAERAAELPRTDGQSGTWSYVPIEIGERTHYMGVYLPYGYDQDRAEPYKTIYMLHGMGQDESDWMGIGSVQKIMDNLVAEGKAEPAVIVSVTSNNNFLGSNYSNVPDVIIPFIEENYNVSDKAEDRAWAGLSMGSSNTQNMINGGKAALFGYFGPWSLGNSVRSTAPDLDKTHIFFGDGSDDFGKLNANAVANLDTLREAGGYCTYETVCGGHDFNTWCQLFRIFVEKYLWNPEAFGDMEELPLGPTVVKDPDSPTGYTVKFLYQNDEAETVTFAGDIGLRNWADPSDTKQYTPFEYVPDTDLDGDGVTDICLMRSGAFTAPMEKLENGLWYYEVPLAAGANQYWFYVDGNTRYMVPDPANHPQWSPNSNWDTKNAYNAVYVPYDEKQGNELMKAREAELPRTDGKTGTWSYVPFQIGERTHYMGVYLPYGYDPNRAEPYKTIYMQHGGGQDESDWMGIGSVQKIMDNLAAEGRTEPAVIVAPGSTAVGSGKYENLFNVIIPFIEKNYNVSTEAMDRAFAGLSMGSMITQGIINADATKFGYYGPWSGGVSVRSTTENLDQVYMLFAGGRYDFGNPSQAAIRNALQYTGANYKYVEVAGAHDFNTWCQMFRIFLDEYLWKPEAFVQEGPKVVPDAESPTGYTVQFVYKNDEAETVTFAGDIALRNWADPTDTKVYTPFEYKPGLMRSGAFTAPMEKREDGYWYYEVPLAAGANQYWFYIDGNTRYMVPDPANHPQWSPNSNWATKNAYNAVYVPYDEKQDFEPMAERAAELPRTDRKVGSWSYVPFKLNEADEKDQYMAVYLPNGYDPDRAEPYKTIYMIHGGGQDESDWMGIGSVQNILDNLIADGKTEPAVLISLSFNNNCLGNVNDGFSNLFNVIIPFVEKNYNVSTEAMDRSLAGLSAGGGTTLSVMKTAGSKFGYYGPWSSSNTNDGFGVVKESLENANVLFGCGSFDPFDRRKASDKTLAEVQALGAAYDNVHVAGAHDFNAWCQLFRIYVEDYLWKSEAFDMVMPDLAVVTEPETHNGVIGSTATFTVEVNRSDVTYQWMYSNNGGWTWTASSMTGSNTASLSVEMKAFRVGQMYKCVITDSQGNTVETKSVSLNESTSDLAIVENPVDYTGAIGTTATFTVAANRSDVTYRWMYSNNGGKTWAVSSQAGCDTASLSVEAKAFRVGQMYKCIVTDAAGHAVESVPVAIAAK